MLSVLELAIFLLGAKGGMDLIKQFMYRRSQSF